MRVMVAMSGGVDSSVAAALVRDAGHHAVGVTMRLWGGESDTGCCSVSDVDDARRVADHLGIDHHVFNLSDDFERHVVDPYVADHAAGRTPNPCIECNRHLKFDVLLRRAEQLGFDAVATGHHARLAPGGDGALRLRRGADPAKDQSYVLYPLSGDDLDSVMFPVGDLTKDEVRAVAARLGLRTAAKPDSQDVCFIQRAEGRASFLRRRIPLTPARVIDGDGALVGEVEAAELVTVGQRKGLGIGGGDRRYVLDVDVPSATVRIGDRGELLTETTTLGRMVWARGPVDGPVTAQVGAHGSPRRASVTASTRGATGHLADADGLEVRWAEPSPRVAPGQSVVLYRGDLVVGGGVAL